MTNLQALRILINDPSLAEFTDDQLQGFLIAAAITESAVAGVSISGDGNLLLSASLATQALVVKYAKIQVQEVSIGGFQTSQGRRQVRMLEQQADRFYQMYLDAPAFAVAEENNTDYNEFYILREQIMKNLP